MTANAQLEKCVRDLQHQHMRMVMLMTHENALARASHPILIVVFLQTLETRQARRVLLSLRFLGAECVVGKGV